MEPYRRLGDAIAAYLRRDIISGQLLPGQWLRQEELADKFNASPIPVREALRALEAEGLVRIYPHRGAVVAKLSAEELSEIYEIRAALEAMAARLGVPNLTQQQLELLEHWVEEMEAPDRDIVALIETNRRFHSLIYEASGRRRLCELIATLRNSTQHYLHAYIRVLGRMPDAQADHRQILAACQQANAEAAAEATYRHLMQVGQALAEYVGYTSQTTEER
jgi:DNA-binding GntR family transcriptional regulator